MAGFTNPDTVHRASTGATAPAAWGDTVNDDINFAVSSKGAQVLTTETTTTTTYTDLTTSGPAVTVTTGTTALVSVSAQMATGTAGDGAAMSFAVSGATVVAASDNFGAVISGSGSVANLTVQCSNGMYYITGLTAGSNTFTAKYRAVTGGTATFLRRNIAVIPLP